MYVQWIPELKANQVRVNEHLFESSSAILRFGAWKKKVNVEHSDQLPDNTIGLSAHLKTGFTIPETLSYEVSINGTELHIGPVIAFMICKGKLDPGILDDYRGYFANYGEVKGLIYLCSLEGVNPRNKTVQGYYYNPQGGKDRWVQGIFPYPDVVYRRVWIARNHRYRDLLARTERKIFNPYFLNKWELWETLRLDPLIRGYLPHTRRLDNLLTMKKMLSSFSSVYLKPVSGSMGSGMLKMEKRPNGYVLFNRYKRKTFLNSDSKAWMFIHRIRKGRKYLIQQSVAFKYQNRQVDFRVIMQKDGRQQWNCTGIIARFGKEGRFYTNDTHSMSLGRDALQMIFSLNDEEVDRKEEEITRVCTTACQAIDRKYGSFGDVGIDVSVDANLKVWLLEINSRHQHTIPSYLHDDRQIYKEVLTRPFAYAKSWAGFTN